MNFSNINIVRKIHSTACMLTKKNFRKFNMYELRGEKRWRYLYFKKGLFKQQKIAERVPDFIRYYDRGVRPRPIEDEFGKEQYIPEMIPELIVPDLEGFKLKPYVSYRVRDVYQSEFTPQELFFAIYSKKIIDDFNEGKLNEDGFPEEMSEEEKLTAEEAKNKALSTGSDVFQHIPQW